MYNDVQLIDAIRIGRRRLVLDGDLLLVARPNLVHHYSGIDK